MELENQSRTFSSWSDKTVYLFFTPQALYLMPSSSARCAQFPRAQDKVHFYIKLRELRDQLKGVQRQETEIQEVNYSFDLGLAKGKIHSDHGHNVCNQWFKSHLSLCVGIF